MELSLNRNGVVDKIKVSNVNALNLIGQSFSNELNFLCTIHASDIFEAIGISKRDIEKYLDQLAFLVGMPVNEVQIVKAYDITPNIEDREYVQFFYDVLDKVGSRSASPLNMNHVLNEIDNKRINRAVHWYRKSIAEDDPLDRFTYLWIGLETLNPLFQEIYPDSIEVSKCENCGFERQNQNTAALKKFFLDQMNDEKTYSHSRRLRQGLMHGFADFNKTTLEALDLIDALSIGLNTAICTLAKINPDMVNKQIETGESEQIIFLLRVKLDKLIVDESNPNYEEPYFGLEVTIKEHDNKLVFHPVVSTTIMDRGVGLAGLEYHLLGSPGYPFELTQIAIKA